jgi:hypothetical protein
MIYFSICLAVNVTPLIVYGVSIVDGSWWVGLLMRIRRKNPNGMTRGVSVSVDTLATEHCPRLMVCSCFTHSQILTMGTETDIITSLERD